MDATRQIRELSAALNIPEWPQDWGIINSDPARIEEFIQFSEREALTTVQQWAMAELVFASMNEALVETVADPMTVDRFERFLAGGLHGVPDQVRYWSSLEDAEEFPIADLLRRLVTLA